MGIKFKIVPGSVSGLQKLANDVPAGNVAFYTVNTFPVGVISDEYLDKCSHVTVAVSGTPGGQDWMIICPHRIDVQSVSASDEGFQAMSDIDPLIVVVDSDTSIPGPSGIIGYHQNFEGRTTAIEEHHFSDVATTVSQLRSKIIPSMQHIDEAPESVKNALFHMHKRFIKLIGDDT